MGDFLARSQRYLDLALHLHEAAETEFDEDRLGQLMDLAAQYEKLAEKFFRMQQNNAPMSEPSGSPGFRLIASQDSPKLDGG